MDRNRFELRAPSNQTIADIFRGGWATDLATVCGVVGTGSAGLFEDPRIGMAASVLGQNDRFDGCKVLELGPLEGAHSYQIEMLGAKSNTAVEANSDAFLKCLLVKEMLQMKTRYLCGDVVSYLRESNEEFDLIFCCGILYHMSDPVELIKQICLHTSRCFVWTHHYDLDAPLREGTRSPRTIVKNGFETTYYERPYPTMEGALFLGGNQRQTAWLTQPEITRAFAHFGLSRGSVLAETRDFNLGAHFSCAYSRSV